jgi:PAS domain S-box-containing protein
MKAKKRRATKASVKRPRVRARSGPRTARKRPGEMEKLIYLAAIVDSTGESIISYNLDGIITTWNAGATQLFGYTAAEAIGQSVMMIVPESLRPATSEIFQGLHNNSEQIEHLETARIRKDGSRVDVYVTISPIKGPDGKVIGASSIAYDITERKRIEDERTKMIEQLNETLSKVRTLSGLLPICASCKKIRDDQGYWQKLETFVHEHSNAEFSHSICPDCMEKLYPDFSKRKT